MRGLKSLVKNFVPMGLFLMETKFDFSRMYKIAKFLPFEYAEFVEANWRVGGLALLWSSEVDWQVTYKSD